MCTAVKFRNGVKGDDRGEVRYVSKRVCIIPVMHIAKKITKTDLNEGGKEMRSIEFADYMRHKMNTVNKRLVFIIGGPYGFSPKVYAAAHERLSLSRMTFSHQMVRLIFIEQLYRAMSILNGSPYHHE